MELGESGLAATVAVTAEQGKSGVVVSMVKQGEPGVMAIVVRGVCHIGGVGSSGSGIGGVGDHWSTGGELKHGYRRPPKILRFPGSHNIC